MRSTTPSTPDSRAPSKARAPSDVGAVISRRGVGFGLFGRGELSSPSPPFLTAASHEACARLRASWNAATRFSAGISVQSRASARTTLSSEPFSSPSQPSGVFEDDDDDKDSALRTSAGVLRSTATPTLFPVTSDSRPSSKRTTTASNLASVAKSAAFATSDSSKRRTRTPDSAAAWAASAVSG